MKKIFYLLLFVLGCYSHCMSMDGIRFDIQAPSSCKKLIVKVAHPHPDVKLLTFDDALKKSDELIVPCGSEDNGQLELGVTRIRIDEAVVINVFDDLETPLFDLLVSRDHEHNSPIIGFKSLSTSMKTALFFSRGGGGGSYVIAFGTEQQTSVEEVKKKHKSGKFKTFIPVAPIE